MKFQLLLTLSVLGAGLCYAGSPAATDVYARSIQELGGAVQNPMIYPETVAGFADFLAASGVKTVTAADLTRPNHPAIAARLGFQNFLPPRAWWPRGAALALLTQSLSKVTNAAVRVRNWWRPDAYNRDSGVGGAKDGDHPTANAVDLDYSSTGARAKAELFLRALAQRCPWMQLSLGLGPQSTHIGIGSPRGHREWHYAGWVPARAIKASA